MYTNEAFSSGSYAEMLSGSSLLPHHYSESVGSQNEMKFMTAVTMQPIDGHPSGNTPLTGNPSCNSFTGDSHVIPRTQLGLVDNDQNRQCQSLGTLRPSTASIPPFRYQYSTTGLSPLMTNCFPNFKGVISLKDDETGLHQDLRSGGVACVSYGGSQNTIKKEAFHNPHSSVCLQEVLSDPGLHGSPGLANTVLNSLYLKAAQDLLHEIVNVRKALKQPQPELEKHKSFHDIGLDGSKDADGRSTSQSVQVSSYPNSSTNNSSCELSPAERQNLLDKKTKLLSMLDEVDKRYRQYCHEMQIVVSSFDTVAGCGAAEPYTAVALRTISRHFRCLRDAISGQIQVTQRKLGEQEGIPRLRYVDQQPSVMRQAWRPQRGLPESSVSILRAWLFEHFLHPYPKDSEKITLARQTGLTRNQVANWFINARVRLWKPMVEEMYKQEFGNSEMSCNLSSENIPRTPRDDVQVSDNKGEESEENLIIVDSVQGRLLKGSKMSHTCSNEMDERAMRMGIQSSGNRENVTESGSMKLQGEQRSNSNNGFYSSRPITTNQNSDDCVMAPTPATYDLSELGSFGVSGHVSLALELRNCENDGFAMSDGGIHKRRNQRFASSPENDLLDYHFSDQGKQQHRFSNTHLLHEFVV